MLGLVMLAAVLVGCGGGESAEAPQKEKPKAEEATSSKSQPETKSVGKAEGAGEKDITASAQFADYMHKNYGGSNRPWWYASISDFPEARKGSKGIVGVITVHIIPSDKSKTDQIVSNIATAALGCTNPKIDTLIIMDKSGKTLLEKKR